MNIEISRNQIETLMQEELGKSIDDIAQMISDNYAWHFLDIGTFAPLYSWDYKEEDKKLQKLLKSLIRVNNYYSMEEYNGEHS